MWKWTNPFHSWTFQNEVCACLSQQSPAGLRVQFPTAVSQTSYVSESFVKAGNPRKGEGVAGFQHVEPQHCEWKDQVFLSWLYSGEDWEAYPRMHLETIGFQETHPVDLGKQLLGSQNTQSPIPLAFSHSSLSFLLPFPHLSFCLSFLSFSFCNLKEVIPFYPTLDPWN